MNRMEKLPVNQQSSFIPIFGKITIKVDLQQVIFKDLGYKEYKEAWDLQESLLQANVQIKTAARIGNENYDPKTLPTKHYFLLCEHPPVYTLGKSGKLEHLLMNNEMLKAKGISFFNTNRGGDITFHGPQQIVGYPIFDLEKMYTDIGLYLRNMEEAIIHTLAEYGIEGDRSPGETGVWLDPNKRGKERKICAMGVRCSRWITMHGFALNVNTDLSYFNNIIPCGIQNKQVTSIEKELGRKADFEEVKHKVKENFEKIFHIQLINE